MILPPPTYSLHRIGKAMPMSKGLTEPSFCTLNAIVKFDSPHVPHSVYNEIVALRLGELINAPVAAGGLVSTDAGIAYASLRVGSASMSLPDLLPQHRRKAAELYPDAAAGLLVFDVWIGNDDRFGNIKASLVTPHVRIFRGFDHGATLLTTGDTLKESLERLREDVIVFKHPFFGLVRRPLLEKWVARINSVAGALVDEACRFGRPFGDVSEHMQTSLAKALKARSRILPKLILDADERIRPIL